MLPKFLSRMFGSDIAIDLGTANTLIYLAGEGVVLSEPSVVAISRDRRGPDRIESVGEGAKSMLGRAPEELEIVRPIRDGVISRFDVTQEMLRSFIRRVKRRKLILRPRVVIAVPAGLNDVERRAVREAAVMAGAHEVFLIDEAVAAAIGSGLDVNAADATMVVDVGGGTTEVAVVSCSGVIYSCSTRLGGDRMDEAIIQFVRRTYNVLIGQLTAERIKIEVGTAPEDQPPACLRVQGRDLIADAPKTLVIKSDEVRDALAEPISGIVDRVRVALEGIPAEISADIAEKGIVLVGGGALLGNLKSRMRMALGLPVRVAEDPLTAVALGAGCCLEDATLREKLAIRP